MKQKHLTLEEREFIEEASQGFGRKAQELTVAD